MWRFLFTVAGALSSDPSLDLNSYLSRPILGANECHERIHEYLVTASENAAYSSGIPFSPDKWDAAASARRQIFLNSVVFRGRDRKWRNSPARVEWHETIPGGDGYRIHKLCFEAFEGLWIPALLYEPTDVQGKRPAVLNVNGHEPKGKAAPYKQIHCINQAKRGLYALNVEWIGFGQLNHADYLHYRMNQIDLCGTSGLAVFYLSMSRALDLLASHPHVDPSRIAMTGLSGGGWQTLLLSAMDTRIALSNPVAGYSTLRTRAEHANEMGDSEQLACDWGTLDDYGGLTTLLAPRPTLLTYCQKDECCFQAPYTIPPLLERAQPFFEILNASHHLRTHVNHDPGTHNYERDNREAFYRMVGEFFFPEDKNFEAKEVACEREIKSSEELLVPLPPDNATFSTIARSLARDLPTSSRPEDLRDNQVTDAKRQTIRELLRYGQVEARAVTVASEMAANHAIHWQQVNAKRLVLGVPLVTIEPSQPTRTVIVLNDDGRKAAADLVQPLADGATRIAACDLLNIGEGGPIPIAPLLFLDCVGKRPLSEQVHELSAVLRYFRKKYPNTPIDIVARGHKTTLVALLAAVVDPGIARSLTLNKSLESLKTVIDQNEPVTTRPELFCFGLLEVADVPTLAVLALPARITFVDASEALTTKLRSILQMQSSKLIEFKSNQ